MEPLLPTELGLPVLARCEHRATFVDIFDRIDSGFSRQTTEDMHLYADSDNGDDDNDGLTLATAKQTLAGVLAEVPYFVLHNVQVELIGTFDIGVGIYSMEFYVAPGKRFLLHGGDEVETLAGPWVADYHWVDRIGFTGMGLATDQHRGHHLTVDDGPCVGQTRTIAENTKGEATGTGDDLTFEGFLTKLTDAAATFTADDVGRFIEITGATTPANNGIFPILEFVDANNIKFINPAGVTEAYAGDWTTYDGLVPVRHFSEDPGTATFRVTRPKTTIEGSAQWRFTNTGGGEMKMQNLYVTDQVQMWATWGNGDMLLSHIIHDSTAFVTITAYSCNRFYCRGTLWDTTDPALPTLEGADKPFCGVSQLDFDFSRFGGIYTNECWVEIEGSVVARVLNYKCHVHFFGKGSNSLVGGVAGTRGDPITPQTWTDESGSGYAKTKFLGSPIPLPGLATLYVADSALKMGALRIDAPALGHGIILDYSILKLNQALEGTCGAFGVVLNNISCVNTFPGDPPTITGAGGDFSYDGAAPGSTWAAVEGGAPSNDNTQQSMVIARKVPVYEGF